jgi:chitin synthase
MKGARENADELARTLYALLFSWIMERINDRLSQSNTIWSSEIESSLVDSTISVVDFPGFTISSTVPNLDKLLHNSANEILYYYTLQFYFERKNDKFLSEELVVPDAQYFDNRDTVKTLFHPSQGLLQLIDDYCRRDKTDGQLLDSMSRRFTKSPVLEVVSARRSFTVKHFVGEVEYDADTLLSSSKEAISGDFISLFTSSTSSDFLKTLFANSAVVDDTFGRSQTVVSAHLSSRPKRAPTIRTKSRRMSRGAFADSKHGESRKGKRGSSEDASKDACGQFARAMDSLIHSFHGANAYFVMCLKPNDHRLPNSFDARCVRQQITAFGIPDLAKRVKQTDYSIFLPFSEFIATAEAEWPEASRSLNAAVFSKASNIRLANFWHRADRREIKRQILFHPVGGQAKTRCTVFLEFCLARMRG